MSNFKLKILLSLLAGIVFSFLFILLALLLPIKKKHTNGFINKTPKGKLEQISQSLNK